MHKKQRSYGQIISMLFYVAAGVAIGLVDRQYIIDFVYKVMSLGISDASVITVLFYVTVFLFVLVSLGVHVIMHETGHLIFGLLSGYRFVSFRIFSFMWIRTDEGLKSKRMSLAGTAGQCLMSPPDLRDGKIPVLLYNFGGVIVNVLLSVLFYELSLVTGVDFLLPMFLKIAAVMGIVIAATNGIPMSVGTVSNDGKNALSLGHDREAMRAFWIQLKVNEEIAKGVRIKDMPAEWFTVPEEGAMKNGIKAVLGVLAANRLMDERRFEEAKELTEHVLSVGSGVAGLHRALLTCDLIYIELIGENRPEQINALMTKEQQKLMKALKTSVSVIRTEYALALLSEKDKGKAEKAKERFEKVACRYPYPVDILGEGELMDIAERKYRESL